MKSLSNPRLRWAVAGLLVVEALATVGYIRWRNAAALHRFELHVPADVVWAPGRPALGDAGAQYRIVEFGDFQCPPCRMASKTIQDWLAGSPRLFRFEFRNLPLSDLHPKAYQMALISESAVPSDYWKIHRRLFDLQASTGDTLNSISRAVTPALVTARSRISADKEVADKFGWDSTPTLILITPKQQVYRCPSVAAAKNWIDQGI